jgi:hypothetical protein
MASRTTPKGGSGIAVREGKKLSLQWSQTPSDRSADVFFCEILVPIGGCTFSAARDYAVFILILGRAERKARDDGAAKYAKICQYRGEARRFDAAGVLGRVLHQHWGTQWWWALALGAWNRRPPTKTPALGLYWGGVVCISGDGGCAPCHHHHHHQ